MDTRSFQQLTASTPCRSHWLELEPKLQRFLRGQGEGWDRILRGTPLFHQSGRLEAEYKACLAAVSLIERLRSEPGKTAFPSELKGFIAGLGLKVERSRVCELFQLAPSNLSQLCSKFQPVTAKGFLAFSLSTRREATEKSIPSSSTPAATEERKATEAKCDVEKASTEDTALATLTPADFLERNSLPLLAVPSQPVSETTTVPVEELKEEQLPSKTPSVAAESNAEVEQLSNPLDGVEKKLHCLKMPFQPVSGTSNVLAEELKEERLRPKMSSVAEEHSADVEHLSIPLDGVEKKLHSPKDTAGKNEVNFSEKTGEEVVVDGLALEPFVLIDEIRYTADDAKKVLKKSLENRKGNRRFSDKERKLILFLAERLGSRFVHEEFLVTYDTISRLRRERNRQRDNGPVNAKSIPARYANILEIMRKHPGMGPMQMRDYIHRHEGKSLGVNTVRTIMIEAGWVQPVNRKRELLAEEFRRYEAIRRNVMWHSDFLHCYINSCKAYVLFIQDDYSRFIVGYGIFDGERFEAVLEIFEKAMALHGKPESFLSDKGSAFWAWKGVSQFSQVLEDHGIDQMTSNAPQTNGKVENLNQQFSKEVLSADRYSSLDMFQTAVIEWINFYNFERCHQGLDKLEVPADRFYPGFREKKCAEKKSGHQLLLKGLLEALSSQLL